MAYSDIAALAGDLDFAQRTVACVATETYNDPSIDPGLWQAQHNWDMAAQPGFGDAYASALANEIEHPGKDASVISDNQILAAYQSLNAQGGQS